MFANRTQYNEWLNGPAFERIPGTPPSHDSDSLQKYDVPCQAICLTIVTILLFIRAYTKGYILKALGWDDCKSNQMVGVTKPVLIDEHRYLYRCMGIITQSRYLIFSMLT